VSGPRLAVATSWSGMPGPQDLFTTPQASGTRRLTDAVRAALAGETDRLGDLVGPMGVRYVVVPSRLAPGAADTPDGSADGGGEGDGGGDVVRGIPRPAEAGAAPTGVTGVIDALARQLDLVAVPVGGDVAVWQNASWVPARSLGTDGTAVLPGPPGAVTGTLPAPGDLSVATQFDAGWSLQGGETAVDPAEVDGWSMRFDGAPAGEVTLAWSPSAPTRLATLATPALWLAALWWLVRTRSIDGPAPRVPLERDEPRRRLWDEDDEP
jgi:hypothetical protein